MGEGKAEAASSLIFYSHSTSPRGLCFQRVRPVFFARLGSLTTDKDLAWNRARSPLPSRTAQAEPETPQLGSQAWRYPCPDEGLIQGGKAVQQLNTKHTHKGDREDKADNMIES